MHLTYTPIELLTVYLDAEERRKVGRLALRQRQILFEYDPAFITSGIEISPLKLPLRTGVFTSPDAIFDGLYGVFNDSLPDGWGRLLLDRTVEKHGVRRGQLNPLDRLAYVGQHGMGALSYEPSYEPDLSQHSGDDTPLALDRLAEESAIKIVAQVSADKTKIIHGPAQRKRGFEHWMIKFANSQDPRDIGAIEYAYSRMARDAGVDMPETYLFRTKKRGYFGAKRFDRKGDKRIHMHSLSGLIHADHRTPALDYNMLLRVVLVLTKNIAEVEKAYTLACFNVLAHNRDDHAKNFSFLLNGKNSWAFAPAYDLTFSDGPAGEQSTMVMGEGRNPGVEHLKALGKEHYLKSGPRILARVQKAVARWRDHAAEAGVSAKSTNAIADRATL